MALVRHLPQRFADSHHESSKLDIIIEDNSVTGCYIPAVGTGGQSGLLKGVSNLTGMVVQETDSFVMIQGRWIHIAFPVAKGDFELVIDTGGAHGVGWWSNDNDPDNRFDWNLSMDGTQVVDITTIPTEVAPSQETVSPMHEEPEPATPELQRKPSEILARKPTMTKLMRNGSVTLTRQATGIPMSLTRQPTGMSAYTGYTDLIMGTTTIQGNISRRGSMEIITTKMELFSKYNPFPALRYACEASILCLYLYRLFILLKVYPYN